jgi:hypothetical protein
MKEIVRYEVRVFGTVWKKITTIEDAKTQLQDCLKKYDACPVALFEIKETDISSQFLND